MNDLMLRELLEHAADAEPPAPQLARNSLLLGIRLRRRRRAGIAASSVAVLAVAGVSAPAVIGAVDSSGPEPTGAARASIAYVIGTGVSFKCQRQLPGSAATGCPQNPEGSITAIDTATGKVIRAIKVPPQPTAFALTPDGKTLYLADSQGITPVNLIAGSAGKSINVGKSETAFLQIAITPDGKTAYIANYGANSVVPIDTATNRPGRPIRVGSAPDAIAITPDGRTAYVANGNAHSVTPINIPANTAGQPIQTGDWPGPLAITPDGKTVYVADNGAATVTPISTATNTASQPIKVGANPAWLVLTPDGKTVYVLNVAGKIAVTPVTTATNKAGKPIPLTGLPADHTVSFGSHRPATRVAALPTDIAVAPDGSTLYITNESNYVLPISTATNTPGVPLRARAAYTIAVTPDGRTIYVTDAGADTVTPISTATGRVGQPIKVGVGADDIVIGP